MKPIDSNACLYKNFKDDQLELMIMVYVYEFLLMSKNDCSIFKETKDLGFKFEMTYWESCLNAAW